MPTVALEKAQASLPELLRQVAGGEEFTITQNGEPKAKLSPLPAKHVYAHAGSLPGKVWMSPDFDAPLDDFKEFMQAGKPKATIPPSPAKSYRKNGVLVYHTGKKISSVTSEEA